MSTRRGWQKKLLDSLTDDIKQDVYNFYRIYKHDIDVVLKIKKNIREKYNYHISNINISVILRKCHNCKSPLTPNQRIYYDFNPELQEQLVEMYKTKSLTEINKYFWEYHNIPREKIINYLKINGIYDKLINNKKQSLAMKKSHAERGYSIGYVQQNKISYKIPKFGKEFKEYRGIVEKMTTKMIRKYFYTNNRVDESKMPQYCYYTGIKFDDCKGPTNPNSWLKRSVDHKISIIHGFLLGKTPEEICSMDNLIFVLKYVNTIKGNTVHESFKSMAKILRGRFINEGYEHN